MAADHPTVDGTWQLDPLTLPLQGSRLIEASAGTGKTWTIAALYLRLVLGHGGQPPRLPGEILVMTFTRAATRELSDRIRARLVEAAACFRGQAEASVGDGFLQQLLAAYADDDARRAAAWRLALAAEAMDDAAVHTIDAWCQRMLREHAFDSGSSLDEELLPDLTLLQAEAARDYWRQQVYPLQGEPLAVVLGHWPDADALLRTVRPLLDGVDHLPVQDTPLGEVALQTWRARADALAALKQGWVEHVATMRAWLQAVAARSDKPLDGRSYRKDYVAGWLDKLEAWATDPSAETLDLGKGAERLRGDGVRAALKPGVQIDIPPAFDAFALLMQALAAGLPDVASVLDVHAAAAVTRRLQQLKVQSGRHGFADLLQRLDEALDQSTRGEAARRLRAHIVAQFPVLMVDEFQDTSPLQLSLFDRLYRIAADDGQTTLLLIGDPKQAIYGFRGADIHSYLQARRATAGRHHWLDTNHRATTALVRAVNGLFERAEQRPGAGAFLFRAPDGEPGGGELPFVPVQARGRDEVFVDADGPVPPLVMNVDAVGRGKGDSREHHAALCAERIVRWLSDAQAGFVRPDRPDRTEQPGAAFERLRPAHIAVLVRTGTEAKAVRQALRRRGVQSVYLSDGESVFASDEAQDLLRLLQAVASPRDARLARAALATPLLGLTLAELLRLADDEQAFDARCERLAELQQVWHAQGVLAMLRRLLQALGLPARWLQGPDAAAGGERRLTNVLHLAELLQAEAGQGKAVAGEQALIRWLAGQIDAATQAGRGAAADEQVLRLESDADLVKVVTIHKSKGLEYPVVLLPFAAAFRTLERRNTPWVWQADEQGRRQRVLGPDHTQLARADEDRLREDLRLLYVALTRARHALWLGVAALRRGAGTAGNGGTSALPCEWHRSALGQLVSGAQQHTPDEVLAELQALAGVVPGLTLEAALPFGEVPLTRWQAPQAATALRPAPVFEARFDRLWSVASYSALVKGAGGDTTAAMVPAMALISGTPTLPPLAAQRLLRDDEPSAPGDSAAMGSTDLATARGDGAPWHRFLRGALAGNFLHDQLEWLAGEGFALATSASLQAALRRRCERHGVAQGSRADDVQDWLQRVCTVPLGLHAAPAVPLAGLRRTLPEMEFWLPVEALRARAVDELCRRHVLPGRPRPELPERALHGLLMGFADLVFEHEGRYGVLDYKSNWLGPGDADYGQAAMEAAMLAHRYDVQAVLYLLALHRLLRTRLGGYRPAEHLHGALYLFLRGVAAPGGGVCHVAPPVELLDELDRLLPQGPQGPQGPQEPL